MATDLERAYEALSGKQSAYNTYWDYYDGDQPLVYSTERLREIFRGLDAVFVQNWCAVVIDAAMDRINLARFAVAGNETLDARLNEIFMETQLNLDSADAHLATLVTGEAFVVAWGGAPPRSPPQSRGEEVGVEAFYNDPRLCHIEYNRENPRLKEWAAKWWVDEEEKYQLTLYYRDRLEYYVSGNKARDVTSAAAFVQAEQPVAENPYGEIPVFHLRRERRKTISELVNVLPLQDAINKLLADMMVAAEYGAFRQRYVISNADNLGALKNAPNEIWDLPAGDGMGQPTQVGEFGETRLANFYEMIDTLARSIGIITRTPKHYFYGQGGEISGEALIAMEAPLNKKCERYITRFASTWAQVGSFLLRLDGQTVDESQVTAVFEDPETVQPRTEAEIRGLNVQAGLPLTTALRWEGRSEAEIEQVGEDRGAERAEAVNSLAIGLLEQQRQFDQNGREGE